MTDKYERHLFNGFPTNEAIVVHGEQGEPNVVAFLMDDEYDPVVIKFPYPCDGLEIEIQTAGYQWVTFYASTLEKIISLAEDADALWAEMEAYWHYDACDWIGWESMLTKPEKIADERPLQ